MFVHSRFVDLDTVEGWPRIVASVRHDPHPVRPTRRRLLQLLAAGAGVGVFGTMPVLAQPIAPTIRPRSAWGGDLPPQGPLEAEAPGDVRFLLVHHTASGNTYEPGDVVGMIRSFHRTHTGPDKGWPDVAYNFFVDRFGTIWEGREGSIDLPIKGSATGGSQGFAQLCCFIGNHEEEPPTAEAEAAMTELLAWLAGRYGINPQGTTEFVSGGSNRHPAGTTVVTPTIVPHREMSQTVCPGRYGVELVTRLPALVAARSAGFAQAPSPTAPVSTVEATPEAAAPLPSTQPTEQALATGPTAAVPSASGVPTPADPVLSVPTVPGTTLNGKALLNANVKVYGSDDIGRLRLTAAGLLATVSTAIGVVIRRRGLR